jgi:hypothetical protein
MLAADRIPPLVGCDAVNQVQPERCGEFVFSLERIEAIAGEIMPLHQAHWDETEGHRHGLPFDPDYPAFIRYEQVLLTLRMGGMPRGLNRNGKLTASCSRQSKSEWCRTPAPSIPPNARKERLRRLRRMLPAAGNLGLGQYQGQLNAWQQASQNSASSAAGLENLIGQLGSAYMMKPVPLRWGGIIKRVETSRSSPATEPAG